MSTIVQGYLDRYGDYVVPRSLHLAEPFSGGVAMAKPMGAAHFGFFNIHGDWVMKPKGDWYGGTKNGVHTFNIGGQQGERRIEGGLWGMAGDGRVLVEPKFKRIQNFADGRIPVFDGEKWGYADKNGDMVIEYGFDWAEDFSEVAAVVSIDGKDGYLKPDGSFLLAVGERQLWAFSGARGRSKRGDEWFLITPEGQDLSEAFDEIWPMRAGMAQVKRGEKMGFIDTNGQLIGDKWFDEARWYEGGLAPARIGEEWFVLDASGQLHGPYNSASATSESAVAFVNDEGVGFLSADGTTIASGLDSGRGFSNGYAGVKQDGKWTFIDPDGKQMYEPRWDDVGAFSAGGFCPTRKGARWGVCDSIGRVLVTHRHTRISNYSEGMASAQRLTWDRDIDPPGPGVAAMPAGGLTHPVFAETSAADDLRLTVLFQPVMDERQILLLRHLSWGAKSAFDARAEDGEALFNGRFWLTPYSFSMRLQGLAQPVLSADLFMDAVEELELPVKELAFHLLRDDPEVPPNWQLLYPFKPAAKHPDDTLGPNAFPDFETYWEAIWDFEQVAPRSENLFYLRIARFDQGYNIVFAERLLSLHVPGIRLCMGTMQNAPSFVERDDARKDQVESVLIDKVAERFAADKVWVPPFIENYQPPFPARGDWTPGVQTLEHEGRKGYSFAFDPPSLIQDVGPDIFRYREQELMEALAAAVAELDLAPVILWQLFGEPLHQDMPHMAGTPAPTAAGYYICQLWER